MELSLYLENGAIYSHSFLCDETLIEMTRLNLWLSWTKTKTAWRKRQRPLANVNKAWGEDVVSLLIEEVYLLYLMK